MYTEKMEEAVDKFLSDKKIYSKEDYEMFFKKIDNIPHYSEYYFYQHLCNNLKPHAENGDIRAIAIIIYLYQRNIYIYSQVDPHILIKYYLKISDDKNTRYLFADDLDNIFDTRNNFFPCFATMAKNNIALKKELDQLKNENAKLRVQIEYMPGGSGFKKAEKEFNTIAKTQD